MNIVTSQERESHHGTAYDKPVAGPGRLDLCREYTILQPRWCQMAPAEYHYEAVVIIPHFPTFPPIDELVFRVAGGGPRLSRALFQSTALPKGTYFILSVPPTLECLPAPSPGLRQSKTWRLIYQAIGVVQANRLPALYHFPCPMVMYQPGPEIRETLPARDCRYRLTKNGTSVLGTVFLNGEDHFSVGVHWS